MAAKKKPCNYWYVLVMTDSGPTFVTSVEYAPKVAHWNKLEKPLELGKYRAEDLALGLNLNLHTAFAVCSKFELDSQPYRYELGEFEWIDKKDKDSKTA